MVAVVQIMNQIMCLIAGNYYKRRMRGLRSMRKRRIGRMERLTVNDLNKVYYDPWELCGMDNYCKRGCYEEDGCTKGCHILKMYRKLTEYEGLEEQGKLLKLPCAVGDTVYTIHNVKRKGQISKEIWENVVTSFNVERDCDWNISFEHVEPSGLICPNYCEFKHIGSYVFLTKSAAEQALKEREGKNGN